MALLMPSKSNTTELHPLFLKELHKIICIDVSYGPENMYLWWCTILGYGAAASHHEIHHKCDI